MDNSKIVEGLNDLLAKNYDSERGYRNAAGKTENPTLAAFYRNKASQRNSFGHQIKDHIGQLGGEPVKGTSIAGDLHNAWMNFKTVLSFDKEEAILDAIEDGEEACIGDYNDFLKMENVPTNIKSTITQQKRQVENALRSVENFEDQYDD